MFKQPTTVIIGAGASCELGLPSGDVLKRQIAELLEPTREHIWLFKDQLLFESVSRRAPEVQEERRAWLGSLAAAAQRIQRGLPWSPSIDNFLHTHQNDLATKELEMAAIALAILRAERRSHFFRGAVGKYSKNEWDREPTLTSGELHNSWFGPFARLLFSQVTKDEPALAFRDVRFVIFNYDRCLEQFLWMAAQEHFGIRPEEAATLLEEVEFLHP